ncbi:hypothetical protein AB0B50_00125 [Streptomyces sp. NPDC041068]|uniref:hypothetical protein n=1 Tax=Streptomyces sp. NPDC041068 TaxID=3155130 RepID=UPI0033DC6883
MDSRKGSGDGSARKTARRYLKRHSVDQSEQSWLCPKHKDPEAMELLCKARYVCAHCTRERSLT